MSRELLPFQAPDISSVAKSLRAQLSDHEGRPGHVELLNMLARAAGFRNFQHLRAQHAAKQRLETPPEPPAQVDYVKLTKLARYFGPDGRFVRWPSKYSHREPCLWVLWSRIPARQDFTEADINLLLAGMNGFGDHVTIRREMVNLRMIGRTTDCRRYWRVERQPPAEALALIRAVGGARA